MYVGEFVLGQVHQSIYAILVGNCVRLRMQDAIAGGGFLIRFVVVAIQELKHRFNGIEVIVFEMYDTSLSFLVNDQLSFGISGASAEQHTLKASFFHAFLEKRDRVHTIAL